MNVEELKVVVKELNELQTQINEMSKYLTSVVQEVNSAIKAAEHQKLLDMARAQRIQSENKPRVYPKCTECGNLDWNRYKGTQIRYDIEKEVKNEHMTYFDYPESRL